MKIYKDIKQNTKEWYNIRKLKFTASHASTIMAQGKGLKTLIRDMLAEYYSSGNYPEYEDKYKNSDIDRGNKFEDKARTIYELETGNEVEQIGFAELDEYPAGASPDALSGEDGLVEFKNHNDKVFTQLLIDGKIKPEYINQMQMQMYVTGRKWCDYFAFNPNFTPCYFLKRFYPDLDAYERIEQGIKTGMEMLNKQKEQLDKILEKGG